MSPSPSSARKVGLLLLVALALGMAAIFLVGEKRNLFSQKSDYFIRFDSVPGLSAGSNVQLDGVGVGSVAASELCTKCNPELFFSHRRDGERTGRQAGLVWMD